MPEDAYAAAGVSIASSDAGVRALVDVLRTIDTAGRAARCWARVITRACCASRADLAIALSPTASAPSSSSPSRPGAWARSGSTASR